MDRRNFIKLAGLSFIAPFFGDFMPQSDEILLKVLDDISAGKGMNPSDRMNLKTSLAELNNVKTIAGGWISNVGSVKQSAVDFPFFPLIKSEAFDVDKSEFIVEIPESYNHLFIIGHAKTTDASNSLLKMQANDDTGANYSSQRMSSAQTVVTAQDSSTDTYLHVGPLVAGGATAGEGGFFALFFPHYKSSFYKSCISIEGVFRLSPVVSSNAIFASQWRNTAILKKLRFFSLTGNIKAGSLISIYGVN